MQGPGSTRRTPLPGTFARAAKKQQSVHTSVADILQRACIPRIYLSSIAPASRSASVEPRNRR
eukprot:1148296-Pyramimonas_sp.AAC.1